MYGTTSIFLERLNINSILDLPELGEFVPAPDVVEALEHGLRFEETDPPVVVEDSVPAEESAPTEVSADEEGQDVVLDLRDSVVGVNTAQASEQE